MILNKTIFLLILAILFLPNKQKKRFNFLAVTHIFAAKSSFLHHGSVRIVVFLLLDVCAMVLLFLRKVALIEEIK